MQTRTGVADATGANRVLLNNGDPFPAISVQLAGGERLVIPDDLAGSYAVVLLYRGSWCPYCNAQLAAFSRARQKLDAIGVKVVALSVDDEPRTQALIDKHRLEFPVGFGADVDEIAALTGAYTNADPKYFESTDFVLSPDGRVVVAVYSSGAIGRLMPDDVAGFVSYVQSHAE